MKPSFFSLVLVCGGCATSSAFHTHVGVPVMLGPIDRIHGAARPISNADPTIEAEVFDDHGMYGSSFDFNAISTAIARATHASGKALDTSRVVYVERVKTGAYLFWSIPYLTPIDLFRRHTVKIYGTADDGMVRPSSARGAL